MKHESLDGPTTAQGPILDLVHAQNAREYLNALVSNSVTKSLLVPSLAELER